MTVRIERIAGRDPNERSTAVIYVDGESIGSASMSGGACMVMKALAEKLGAEASIEEKEE